MHSFINSGFAYKKVLKKWIYNRKKIKTQQENTNLHNGLNFSSPLKIKETDLKSIPIPGMKASLFVDY